MLNEYLNTFFICLQIVYTILLIDNEMRNR